MIVSRVEDLLARLWPLLLAGALCIGLSSGCTVTRELQPDGRVITIVRAVEPLEGTARAIEDKTGVDIESVAGAVLDAVNENPDSFLDILTGTPQGILGGITALIGGVAGGYALRRKRKARLAREKTPEPPKEEPDV